ncbi:glycosyltransferase family 39 protein [Clostridium sp.]
MKKIKLTREKILLSLILILSAILNFANLSIQGYSNLYYAAGVKSMTMSWKNFFFVSFDPASVVTIDKPPLGFWIQAISAKIFGYSGWSILLPQALAGVISVWVIYKIVKRSFGHVAGLLAALFLATTPIFVAVSRNNTCDNLLVLTLLIACWFISIAAEKGKFKYLIISLAIVGAGFNIKMLQAYMVIPAIYLVYLLSSAISLKKRIIHLICGTLVLLVVSFSWSIVVDLIPAANRPYVGSSTNNSEIELIIGHNGLERLGIGSSTTKSGGGNAKTQGELTEAGTTSTQTTSSSEADDSSSSASSNTNTQGGTPPSGTRPSGMPSGGEMPTGGKPGGGQGGSSNNGGQSVSSVTRLFVTTGLSDQIIWLFPIAVLGLLAAALKEKFKPAFNNKRKLDLLLWSMWLIPSFIYFSFTTGLFHPYYLTMLAAPIAALAAIGIVSMWDLYIEDTLKSWILPVTLIVDGAVQLFVLSYFYDTSSITKILMISLSILCFASSIILIILKIKKNNNLKLSKMLVAIALIGLLITPTVWSATALFAAESGSMPAVGLSLLSKNADSSMGDSESSDNTKLIEFLQANKEAEKYILVTASANGTASDIVIKTGEAVMTWGFFGTDKVITLAQFKTLVKNGEVRYVMVGGQGSTDDIMTWAKTFGTLVAESEWKDTTTSNAATATTSKSQQRGGQSSEALYDLKGVDTTK